MKFRVILIGVYVAILASLGWSQSAEIPKAPEGVDLTRWWQAHALWFGRVYPANNRALKGSLVIEVIWETPEYLEAALAAVAEEQGPDRVADYLRQAREMTAWALWIYNRTGQTIRLKQFSEWKISIVDDRGRFYKPIAWDAIPRAMSPGAIFTGMAVLSEKVDREKFRSIEFSFASPLSGEIYRYHWSSDIFEQYYRRDPSMIYWHMAAYWPEAFKKHLDLERDVFPYWRQRYGLKEGESYPKTNP